MLLVSRKITIPAGLRLSAKGGSGDAGEIGAGTGGGGGGGIAVAVYQVLSGTFVSGTNISAAGGGGANAGTTGLVITMAVSG